jgi:hypothetical protein
MGVIRNRKTPQNALFLPKMRKVCAFNVYLQPDIPPWFDALRGQFSAFWKPIGRFALL